MNGQKERKMIFALEVSEPKVWYYRLLQYHCWHALWLLNINSQPPILNARALNKLADNGEVRRQTARFSMARKVMRRKVKFPFYLMVLIVLLGPAKLDLELVCVWDSMKASRVVWLSRFWFSLTTEAQTLPTATRRNLEQANRQQQRIAGSLGCCWQFIGSNNSQNALIIKKPLVLLCCVLLILAELTAETSSKASLVVLFEPKLSRFLDLSQTLNNVGLLLLVQCLAKVLASG